MPAAFLRALLMIVRGFFAQEQSGRRKISADCSKALSWPKKKNKKKLFSPQNLSTLQGETGFSFG